MIRIGRLLLLFVVAVMVFAALQQASAAIDGGGALDDNFQSFVYYAETGEFAFDRGFPNATWDQLDLSSSSGIFVFHEIANPIFTTHSETHLATNFNLSIPSVSIGLVSQPALTEAFFAFGPHRFCILRSSLRSGGAGLGLCPAHRSEAVAMDPASVRVDDVAAEVDILPQALILRDGVVASAA